MDEPGAPQGRYLWLDPSFGASGDMILGALVGLGVPVSSVISRLETLALDGWNIVESTTQRGSLTATRVEVKSADADHHRSWSTIDEILTNANLPRAAGDGARSTFRALAETEARIHGIPIDEVHFHEVGAIDAIIDITGAWLALDHLAVTEVHCGPVGLGHGTVAAAHGRLPLPAPATADLLQGVAIRPVDAAMETVTPTGAALLRTMTDRWGPLPEGVLAATARGAGSLDPDSHPNVLTAAVIEQSLAATAGPAGRQQSEATISNAVLIQTNLDDVTGEVVAHTIDRCLELGADDAWAHPIVMKKGRPGVELNVLARAELVDQLRSLVLAETASLGVRVAPVTKHAQPRRFESVEIDGHRIRVKVSPHGAKPEFDDLAAAAQSLHIPLAELSQRALRAFHLARADAGGPDVGDSDRHS